MSPSQERIRRERTQLNVEMKSFQRPTIKDSLASQGMTLRGGRMVRAGQGDMREGTYMELIGSDNEMRMKENPQPPLKDKENTLSPPLHLALKPLVRDPKNPSKNPPPLCLSDSTEMSTDEYNKVSTQLKQAAKSSNKNDQHPLDVPSTDSEAFPRLAKGRSGEGTDQVRNIDVKELYGESLDQFPYITPSRRPAVSESASPYWAESREQIADEHLVTLGRHQQQFLSNLNPKREKVPKNQGSKDLEKDDREELIQSLIRSNGHLAADVAFLKRSVEEIANKYQEAYLWGQENRENSGETLAGWHKRLRDKRQVQELCFDEKEKKNNDNQYDMDRQAQLAIYLKEGEKQLWELKECSRQELLEQQKQRDEFQEERSDIEKAMQASLEGEKRMLERIRKENLAELGRQGLLKELKEKQQQEIDLQVAKQLQLSENARAMKQNQAAEIDRLVQVIDERNGDLGEKVRLRKETKSQDSGRLHKVDKEVLSGSKTLGDIERPWLTPPSPPPSPLPSPPLPPPPSDPGENPEDDPFQTNPKKYHFSGTVQDGDKGYFVGWYIDQKTEKEKWGKMKIINEEQAQPAPPKATANETREEDITASQPQDILDSYPQPLQTPYITNAMNPLPNQPTQSIQPPYYHSTPTITRNHDQKQANQPYFIDTSKPPPHIIQPQQNPYHKEPSVNEEKVTMKRSNTAEEELQNVTVQLAKTQNEMMTTLAQNQIQLQENNTVMMTDLLSCHHNLYVLADVEVYDGKTVRLEDWLL